MNNTPTKRFSPPVNPSTKRPRTPSSPGSAEKQVTSKARMAGHNKVGELTVEALSELLDKKLVNVATKADLGYISEQVEDLRNENEALKKEVASLRRHEKMVRDKLVDLEGRSRRNNLIFKGLNWRDRGTDFKDIVYRFCTDRLGARKQLWINRAHPLGRQGKAIIAHIPSDDDVDYILSQTRNLKGTGFVVHRDFPREVREKRACLAAVRTEVERVAGWRRMPLVFDHLTIDQCRFTWEDGRLRAGQMNGRDKLNKMFSHDFTTFLEKLKNGPTTTAAEEERKEVTDAAAEGSGEGAQDKRVEAARGVNGSGGGDEV